MSTKLNKIDLSNLNDSLKGVTFEVACDVNNPLIGERGASRIFGPQKGATEELAAKRQGVKTIAFAGKLEEL